MGEKGRWCKLAVYRGLRPGWLPIPEWARIDGRVLILGWIPIPGRVLIDKRVLVPRTFLVAGQVLIAGWVLIAGRYHSSTALRLQCFPMPMLVVDNSY